jgi:hypothetical protein
MNTKLKHNLTNDSLYMFLVLERLRHFSDQRKYWRKEAGKCLRQYKSEIDDSVIRMKIARGYFKDLTDKRIIETLLKLRLKDGVLNG